ncbi:MAG: THUMP domain-containing protein [Nanobdellota archaeon]
MESLAITHKGLEKQAEEEIKEKLDCETSCGNSVVRFDSEKRAQLAYQSQSVIKVLKYIGELSVDEKFFEGLRKLLDMKLEGSFRIKCKRDGDHDFSSHDIQEKAGGFILENNDIEVDLEEPDNIIYIYIKDDDCYVGFDELRMDLSKRDYKVFNHPASLKGTLGFLLLRKAGYSKEKVLVDPFCGSGIIPIEAGLYGSGLSPKHYSIDDFPVDEEEYSSEKLDVYGYDCQLNHVRAARKNAKIAGVNEFIGFSKIDVSWLDTKFDEKEVDVIVTDPPRYTEYFKDYKDLVKEFFYQAKFLLKDEGNITLVSNPKTISYIKDLVDGFEVHEEVESSLGRERLVIVKFIKRKD